MKLYIDMDGVLTSFEEAVRNIGAETGLKENATEEEIKNMFEKIDKAGPEFWSEMEWKKEGQKLWSFVEKYEPVLLSSPGNLRYAIPGKEKWIKKNLPGIPFFPETEKWRYAERDAILIDDMAKNIAAWEEHGGIGILHKNAENTIKKIKEILKNKRISHISWDDYFHCILN